MAKMTDEQFDALLGEILREAGERLTEEDREWHDKVPEDFRKAGRDTIAAMSALVLPRKKPRLPPGKRLLLAAALTLSAAGAVTAGGYYGIPSVHAWVDGRIAAVARENETARRPADYVIPDPGEEFTLRDEAFTGGMAYRWFVTDRRQVIVEIAPELPENLSFQGESVAVAGLPAVYSEEEQALLLFDGNAEIYIGYWNGTREETIAYAETLLEANR